MLEIISKHPTLVSVHMKAIERRRVSVVVPLVISWTAEEVQRMVALFDTNYSILTLSFEVEFFFCLATSF